MILFSISTETTGNNARNSLNSINHSFHVYLYIYIVHCTIVCIFSNEVNKFSILYCIFCLCIACYVLWVRIVSQLQYFYDEYIIILFIIMIECFIWIEMYICMYQGLLWIQLQWQYRFSFKIPTDMYIFLQSNRSIKSAWTTVTFGRVCVCVFYIYFGHVT